MGRPVGPNCEFANTANERSHCLVNKMFYLYYKNKWFCDTRTAAVPLIFSRYLRLSNYRPTRRECMPKKRTVIGLFSVFLKNRMNCINFFLTRLKSHPAAFIFLFLIIHCYYFRFLNSFLLFFQPYLIVNI